MAAVAALRQNRLNLGAEVNRAGRRRRRFRRCTSMAQTATPITRVKAPVENRTAGRLFESKRSLIRSDKSISVGRKTRGQAGHENQGTVYTISAAIARLPQPQWDLPGYCQRPFADKQMPRPGLERTSMRRQLLVLKFAAATAVLVVGGHRAALAQHRLLVQGNDKLAIVDRDGKIEWQMPWGGVHDLARAGQWSHRGATRGEQGCRD